MEEEETTEMYCFDIKKEKKNLGLFSFKSSRKKNKKQKHISCVAPIVRTLLSYSIYKTAFWNAPHLCSGSDSALVANGQTVLETQTSVTKSLLSLDSSSSQKVEEEMWELSLSFHVEVEAV